jgi:hypothetical protein
MQRSTLDRPGTKRNGIVPGAASQGPA